MKITLREATEKPLPPSVGTQRSLDWAYARQTSLRALVINSCCNAAAASVRMQLTQVDAGAACLGAS
uniref:Uncharacterized protein n=1 Tax=Oryza barthii TaxID=65489 RepID=A0A0D3FHS9_9ORYZ